jgi:hypothetical protein
MPNISKVTIGTTTYDIAGSGGGTAVSTDTSSSATTTVATNTITKITVAPTSITFTADSETTKIVEWGAIFTTGSSQTSVTIAMSDSSTITWSGDPSGLVSSTSYSVSVIGNSSIGYTGELVPLFY